MSNAMLNIFVRVFQRRMAAGESFEEVAKSYPSLSEDDLNEIRSKLR